MKSNTIEKAKKKKQKMGDDVMTWRDLSRLKLGGLVAGADGRFMMSASSQKV